MRRLKPSRIMVAYSTGSVEYSTVSRVKYKSGFIRRIMVAFNSYLVIFLPCNLIRHDYYATYKSSLSISLLVRDTISESRSDFLLRSKTPVEAPWSLRSIDLRVIALHQSFVNSRMPQNASLVLLFSKPIRVNVFSFVIHKRGNSQYPEQLRFSKLYCT